MTVMTAVLIAGWFASVASADGLPAGPASNFVVRVETVVPIANYRRVHTVTPQELVVARGDNGPKTHRIFRSRLEPRQAEAFSSFLARLPLASLSSEYVDNLVEDGFAMTFDIQIGDSSPKTIIVRNTTNGDLAALCREINHLLPAQFAIHELETGRFGNRGPNSAVNPPHSVVTALAQGGKRRAAGRAGYRGR